MTFHAEAMKENEESVLKLSGVLDITSAGAIQESFQQLKDIKTLVIDFTEVEFVDSTGIGAILEIIYLSEDRRFIIELKGMNDLIEETFETMGLFVILETVQKEIK